MKLILMKFWTFLKKTKGALDYNWYIFYYKSLCKEMSLEGGGGGGGGGGGEEIRG